MDHRPPRDEEFFIDIESGTGMAHITEKGNPEHNDLTRLCSQLMSVDDNIVKLSVSALTVNNSCQDNNVNVVTDSKAEGEKVGDFTGKKMGKEKRKKASSGKKPPRPPRPPRFSLDSSDQKLIKELAELAMMKRARIERMKKKALKASSSSSSMSGSLFAMLFTIIFVLMILLQGMSCRSPGVTFTSPQASQTNENGLVFIREQLNPSATDSILPDSKSSNLSAKISGKVE